MGDQEHVMISFWSSVSVTVWEKREVLLRKVLAPRPLLLHFRKDCHRILLTHAAQGKHP